MEKNYADIEAAFLEDYSLPDFQIPDINMYSNNSNCTGDYRMLFLLRKRGSAYTVYRHSRTAAVHLLFYAIYAMFSASVRQRIRRFHCRRLILIPQRTNQGSSEPVSSSGT